MKKQIYLQPTSKAYSVRYATYLLEGTQEEIKVDGDDGAGYDESLSRRNTGWEDPWALQTDDQFSNNWSDTGW